MAVQVDTNNQPVPVKITHNNDRQHYVIAIDIAKEGGQLWDLTPYFKGRVGDNNFGLQVVWYYQGRLMDLSNKKPYIEGNVGEYSFDDNHEMTMAPDASTVSYTGDPSDCEDGGRATYYFPEQMFPKSGAFKGFIGVRDDTGKTAHVSGVTIWFKVLPGAAQMGHACDFYVHDLEIALANAAEKTREQLNEANTKLNNQLDDANNKLAEAQTNFNNVTAQALQDLRDKYKREVQANEDMSAETRVSLSNLADEVSSVISQIKAQDVVKRSEFSKLSQQVTDKLVGFDSAPSYYKSADEMKSNNPNGTKNICITVDDNHRWLYVNGQWQDCGASTDNAFKAAKRASQDILYGTDIADWERIPGTGSIVEATEEYAQFEDKHIMHLHSVDLINYTIIKSPVFTVDNQDVSIQFPLLTKNLSINGAHLEINQFAAGDDPDDTTQTWGANNVELNLSNSHIDSLKEEHVHLKETTNRIRLQFVIFGTLGDLYVGTPVVNYGTQCISYSPKQTTNALRNYYDYAYNRSQDLLYGKGIEEFILPDVDGVKVSFITNKRFPGSTLVKLTNSTNYWQTCFSPVVPVKSKSIISMQIPAQAISGTSHVMVSLQEFKDEWALEKVTEKFYRVGNDLVVNEYQNIQLDAATKYIRVTVSSNGNGEIVFGMPRLNYGNKCILYDHFNRSNDDNLLKGSFIFDSDQNVFNLTEDERLKFDTVNNHTNNPNIDFIRIPINGDKLSLQIPYQNDGEHSMIAQLRFSESDEDDGKNALNYTLGPSNEYQLTKVENITVPEKAKSVSLRIWPADNTTGEIGMPKLNYGYVCTPYTDRNGAETNDSRYNYMASLSQDLLYGKELSDVNIPDGEGTKSKLVTNEKFPGLKLIDFLNENTDNWEVYKTPIVAVEGGSIVSLQVPGQAVSGTINVFVSVQEYKDEIGSEKVTEKFFHLSNAMSLNKYEGISIDSSANYIRITISSNGKGEMIFGMPRLNYGYECIPYDHLHLNEDDNLLGGFIFDSDQGIFTLTQDDQVSFDMVTKSSDYPDLDFARIPLKKEELSLQLPYQATGESDGKIWLQLRYSDTDQDDSTKNITYSVRPSKDYHIVKFEDINFPESTKSVALRIWPTKGLTGKIGQPKINYGAKCMPYDKYGSDSGVDIGTAASKQTLSIPQLFISSGSQAYGKIVPFKYSSNSESVSGYLTFDIQGDSSQYYEKKNFKIKLFSDADGKDKLKIKLLPSWKKNNKYNLKANWIDTTQARNVVNARLVKQAVAITPLEKPSLSSGILNTPDLGQINGFPVEVYFDNEFHGLYTFNTKKDEVTFGMDSKNDKNEVVSVNISHDAFADAKATVDEKNYSTEIHDQASDNLKSNFTKFMDFINNSTDDDFKANIANYIDVTSLLNELLFGTFSHEYDFYAKSILLATWNEGSYWYVIPYDLDSTWGLNWDGSSIQNDDEYFDLNLALNNDSKAGAVGKFENGNKLLIRVYHLFKAELKQQGKKMRSTVWSTSNIINSFRKFIDTIPIDTYKKEQTKWPTLPSKDLTSFNQIQSYVIKRGQEFDNFLDNLADSQNQDLNPAADNSNEVK